MDDSNSHFVPVQSQERDETTYWNKRLAGAPAMLELQTDYPRPAVHTYRAAVRSLRLSTRVSSQVHALSEQEHVSLFITLLTSFQILLARYTGQEDIVVGWPIVTRNFSRAETSGTYPTNMLPLRTDLSDNPSFRELLRRVHERVLEAIAHKNFPSEKLIEVMKPQHRANNASLFQAIFALGGGASPSTEIGFESAQREEITAAANADIALFMHEEPSNLLGYFRYNRDLFEEGTIDRMVGHWQTLLAGACADPDQAIGSLPLLTEAERKQILVDWNCTQASYPEGQCFHELFEAQARRTPEAPAVTCSGETLSYGELNERANKLAHHLRGLDVKLETPVALYVKRSVDMMVGVLGILKAGGAYLPIDPGHPIDRISYILDDSLARVIVTHSTLARNLSRQMVVVSLDRDWSQIRLQSPSNPQSKVTPDNLAYIIYTSGSTGKPKGVLVTHKGLPNVAEMLRLHFKPCQTSRVLQVASISFDASLWDILMALPFGGRLYIANDEERIPGPALLQFLQHHEINIATLTPSALKALPYVELPALKSIVSMGETCTVDIVRKWSKGRRFFNGYGPTETTIGATMVECTDTDHTPSIGRPFTNTQAYVLDKYLQPVPVGVVGELYLGGVGLARGYHGRPDLTAERFIQHQFDLGPIARLYKTGDLVRWRSNATLEFSGRVDTQVKLRGFRIELGEIEFELLQVPGVREAVVTAREDEPGNKRLVAYVTPRADAAFSRSIARDCLARRLPEYMVPAEWVVVETMPLTPNGKIDRRALPKPGAQQTYSNEATENPRNEIEKRIADIWNDVLKREYTGIYENFFAVGGHSLLAAQVVSRINKHVANITLRTFFECPTIAALAAAVQSRDCHSVTG